MGEDPLEFAVFTSGPSGDAEPVEASNDVLEFSAEEKDVARTDTADGSLSFDVMNRSGGIKSATIHDVIAADPAPEQFAFLRPDPLPTAAAKSVRSSAAQAPPAPDAADDEISNDGSFFSSISLRSFIPPEEQEPDQERDGGLAVAAEAAPGLDSAVVPTAALLADAPVAAMAPPAPAATAALYAAAPVEIVAAQSNTMGSGSILTPQDTPTIAAPRMSLRKLHMPKVSLPRPALPHLAILSNLRHLAIPRPALPHLSLRHAAVARMALPPMDVPFHVRGRRRLLVVAGALAMLLLSTALAAHLTSGHPAVIAKAPAATATSTAQPSATATDLPTDPATALPTVAPTPPPLVVVPPTAAPTAPPTARPTARPTPRPTPPPTPVPTPTPPPPPHPTTDTVSGTLASSGSTCSNSGTATSWSCTYTVITDASGSFGFTFTRTGGSASNNVCISIATEGSTVHSLCGTAATFSPPTAWTLGPGTYTVRVHQTGTHWSATETFSLAINHMS